MKMMNNSQVQEHMNRLETTEGQAQHLVDSYFEALTKISREKGLFFFGEKSIVKKGEKFLCDQFVVLAEKSP